MPAHCAFDAPCTQNRIQPHRPPTRKSRQALLDLSTRNRLLSLPQAATARVLHFADERTVEVYRLLAGESKSMSFAPARAEEEQVAADPAEEQETPATPPCPSPRKASMSVLMRAVWPSAIVT